MLPSELEIYKRRVALGCQDHKIEGIFKALARSLKMAVKRDIYHYELPSTKGML